MKKEDQEWVDETLQEALWEGKRKSFNEVWNFDYHPSPRLVEREDIIEAKEVLLDVFNDWLAYQEHMIPYVYGEQDNIDDFLDTFTPSAQVLLFADYLNGWAEGHCRPSK